MKYRLTVYYRTPLMDKITEYMQFIMDDWKRNDKRLEGCRVFEFKVDHPLSAEQIAKLKATKEDWMEGLEIEEVKVNNVEAGKKCPNCGVEGKWHGEHETAIKNYQFAFGAVADVGWRCWNCGWEWGFEVLEKTEG